MGEQKLLYLKLQQRVKAMLTLLKDVKANNSRVKIGEVEISEEAFSLMKKEFTQICEMPYSNEAFGRVRGNVIPLELISNNVFFREIQVSMNLCKQIAIGQER